MPITSRIIPVTLVGSRLVPCVLVGDDMFFTVGVSVIGCVDIIGG